MFVRRLSRPAAGSDEEVADTSMEDITEAIRSLDGATRSLVMIDAGDEVPHLGVGGGPHLFVVYATYDNLQFYSAARFRVPDESAR